VTKARSTQVVEQVGYVGDPKAQMTQAVQQVGYVGDPKAQVTQVVLQVGYIDSGVAPGGGGERFYAQIIG
jgi:hypothetical protein